MIRTLLLAGSLYDMQTLQAEVVYGSGRCLLENWQVSPDERWFVYTCGWIGVASYPDYETEFYLSDYEVPGGAAWFIRPAVFWDEDRVVYRILDQQVTCYPPSFSTCIESDNPDYPATYSTDTDADTRTLSPILQ